MRTQNKNKMVFGNIVNDNPMLVCLSIIIRWSQAVAAREKSRRSADHSKFWDWTK